MRARALVNVVVAPGQRKRHSVLAE
jgi:hypothetical protein